MSKIYKIVCTNTRTGRTYTQEGTLEQLIKCYGYTLECGASYQREKGNSKINRQPKTIKSLVTNLNNAINNSAANGYASQYYTLEETVTA
jgi:hypothetical protein